MLVPLFNEPTRPLENTVLYAKQQLFVCLFFLGRGKLETKDHVRLDERAFSVGRSRYSPRDESEYNMLCTRANQVMLSLIIDGQVRRRNFPTRENGSHRFAPQLIQLTADSSVPRRGSRTLRRARGTSNCASSLLPSRALPNFIAADFFPLRRVSRTRHVLISVASDASTSASRAQYRAITKYEVDLTSQ